MRLLRFSSCQAHASARHSATGHICPHAGAQSPIHRPHCIQNAAHAVRPEQMGSADFACAGLGKVETAPDVASNAYGGLERLSCSSGVASILLYSHM